MDITESSDMEKITKYYNTPEGSIILNGYKKIDYCDSFRVHLAVNENVDNITTKIFKVPAWVGILMSIRNFIAGFFRLKTGKSIKRNESGYYTIGSRAGFFTVVDRNDNEIVMSQNDKHLGFRTSVMINAGESSCFVNLTTVVRYNNFGGRFYFFFVKPFHRVIMRSLLKRLRAIPV
jgi:hypothetical protein